MIWVASDGEPCLRLLPHVVTVEEQSCTSAAFGLLRFSLTASEKTRTAADHNTWNPSEVLLSFSPVTVALIQSIPPSCPEERPPALELLFSTLVAR